MKQVNPRHRRRRVYVDADIQGRLILALVALEVTLLVVACAFLYARFGAVIDQNLYVIHAANREPLLPALIWELARVVLICAAVNTVALVAAHRIWTRHVRHVLDGMRERLDRVATLDLRPDPQWREAPDRHRLIDLTERWIEGERLRMVALRIATARLPASLPSDPDGREAREALEALREAAGQLRHGSHAGNDRGQE
ncbi:MAG: hypothetical protein KDH20_05900 [Rhodocyclaceae bacterium]|nr:hypothetical protein [Rhodocyclaceae bacterium]